MASLLNKLYYSLPGNQGSGEDEWRKKKPQPKQAPQLLRPNTVQKSSGVSNQGLFGNGNPADNPQDVAFARTQLIKDTIAQANQRNLEIAQVNQQQAAMNARLDQGKSWEQISKETKIPVELVQKFSQKTRPEYGIQGAQAKPSTLQAVANTIGAAGEGLVKPPLEIAKGSLLNNPAMAVDMAKYMTGVLTRNEAAANASKAKIEEKLAKSRTAIRELGQGLAIQGVQAASSVNPFNGLFNQGISDNSYTPGSPVTKFLLGENEIPTIQKSFKDTKAQKGTSQAVTDTVSTVLMDALLAFGAKKGATKYAEKGFAAVGKDVAVNDLAKNTVTQNLLDQANKAPDVVKTTKPVEVPKTTATDKYFHSTPSDKIEGGKLRVSKEGSMGEGVYLHTNEGTAKTHASYQADGNILDQTAYQVKVNSEKVYKLDTNNYPSSKTIENIKSQGYDGIKLKGGETVVFDPKKVELTTEPLKIKPGNSLGLEVDRFKNRPKTPDVPVKAPIATEVAKLTDDQMVKQVTEDLGISKQTATKLVSEHNKPALATNLYGSKDYVIKANNPDAYATKIMKEAKARGDAAAVKGMPAPEGINVKPTETVKVEPIKTAPVETTPKGVKTRDELHNPIVKTYDIPLKNEPKYRLSDDYKYVSEQAVGKNNLTPSEIKRKVITHNGEKFLIVKRSTGALVDTTEAFAKGNIKREYQTNYEVYKDKPGIVNRDGNLIDKKTGEVVAELPTQKSLDSYLKTGLEDKKARIAKEILAQREAIKAKISPDVPLKGQKTVVKTVEKPAHVAPVEGKTVTEPVKTAPKVPTSKEPLTQQIKSLPDSASATTAHTEQIGATLDNLKQGFKDWGAKYTPKQRNTYAREIARLHRDGTPLSPQTKKMYAEIKPLVQGLRDSSKTLTKTGQKIDTYMREQTIGTGEQVPLANTFIDSMNKRFTSSMTREGKIALNKLDDPVNAYVNSTEQIFHDNYSHLQAAKQYKSKGYTAPVDYVKNKTKIAQELASTVSKEVSVSVDGVPKTKAQAKTAESNLVADLQENFKKHGNAKEIHHTSTQRPYGSIIRTERKVWQRTKIRGTNVYEASGMAKYDRAQAQGAGAFKDAGGQTLFDGNKQTPITATKFIKNVQDIYEGVYKRDYADVMNKADFDKHVYQAAKEAHRGGYPMPLESLERSLAGEKQVHFAERNIFDDPATAKAFNAETSYMLKDGRRAKALADQVTNTLVGMFHSGLIGLKPRSAIQQIGELPRVWGVGGTKNTAKGFLESAKLLNPRHIGSVKEFQHEYGLGDSFTKQMLHETQGNSVVNPKKGNIAKRAYSGAQEFTMTGFNAFETTKDITLLKTLEQKYKGVKDPYQRRTKIMDEFNDTAIKGGHYGAISATNKSNAARLALQFGQYSMKDWGLLGERMKAKDYGYVARTIGGKAVTVWPLYKAFGSSIAYSMGINDFKGGPTVSLATATFEQIGRENDRVESERKKGREVEFDMNNVRNELLKQFGPVAVPGGDFLVNKLGVQDLYSKTADTPLLKHDTAINNKKKGYNSSRDGRARFATPTDTWGQVRMFAGGPYNTDNSAEYFNSKPTDISFYGMTNAKGQKYNPVGERYQGLIDNASKAQIPGLIQKGREASTLNKKFYDSPEGKAYRKAHSSKWNPQTQKYESDVITPEKWKEVRADKSDTIFNHNKEAARIRNRDFGDPIDPIYSDKWASHRNEIMDMRMQNTGDDAEMKDIAYSTKKWYKEFSDEYIGYIKENIKRPYNDESEYGPSPRAKEYYKLTAENPGIPENSEKAYPLINEYFKTKEADPDKGKQFFKDHADQLSADFDKQKKDKWTWTNKMRELEGAKPIDWATFQNVTFGYEDDERKVAQDLYWKGKENGWGSGYGKKGGSGGGGGSDSFNKKDMAGIVDFKPNKTPKLSVKAPKYKSGELKKLSVNKIPKFKKNKV